jgi:hypothetical protein
LAISSSGLAAPFLVSHNAVVLYVSKRAATPELVALLKMACERLQRQKTLAGLLRGYLQGAAL